MDAKKQKILGVLMVLPAFIIICVFIVTPIIQDVCTSFTDGNSSQFTVANYVNIFTDPSSLANIFYTLYIVLVTAVISVVIAYLMALYISFGNSRLSRMLEKNYIIPQFVPGIVAVYAMINIISNSGALNRFMRIFGVVCKPNLIYTANGIILMDLWFNIPFAAMIIVSTIGGIPKSIIESARDVGAGKFHVFIKMILPLSYKSALIAGVFVFMGCVGQYTVPSLMGTNNPRMLGVVMYNEYNKYNHTAYAAALAVVMFLLCSVAGVIYIRSQMKKDKWHTQ